MEDKNYTEGIGLRELIIALLKNWKIVLSCFLILTMGAGIYAFLLIKPDFTASVDGSIFIPSDIRTKYGVYKLPSNNSLYYLEFVADDEILEAVSDKLDFKVNIDDLKQNIKVESDKSSENFSILLVSEDADEAKKILEKLKPVFIEKMNLRFTENAIESFLFSMEESLDISAEKQQFLEAKRILLIERLDETDSFLSDNLMNPVYESLAREILSLDLQLDEIDISLEKTSLLYNELEEIKNSIIQQKENKELIIDVDSFPEIIKNRILFDNEINLSQNKLKPGKKTILLFGAVLGLALGIMASLIKAYLKKEF